MLKDFIRQSGPWTIYLAKMKLQNSTKSVNLVKTQLSKKVIKEFYSKTQCFIVIQQSKLLIHNV